MAKKSDAAATGCLIAIGIIVVPFVLLYEWLGPVGFWIIVLLLSVLVLVGFIKQPQDKSGSATPTTAKKKLSRSNRKWETYTRYDTKLNEYVVETDWPAQFKQIEQAITESDYDFARVWLQKFAYTITGNSEVSQELKDWFKRIMTEFAKQDPLYREVMDGVKFVVMRHPGIVQSKMYQLTPHIDQETIRYVLYFAHELGDITRRKKGRSYELFPAGQVIDAEVIDNSAK